MTRLLPVMAEGQTGLRGLARRWLVLALAGVQALLLLGLALHGLVGDGGFGPDFDFANPILPPAAFLVVWLPIALGAIGQGLLGLHPRYRDDTLLRRIGWLFAIGLGFSCARLVFALFGPAALTAPLGLAMLAVLGWALCAIARWPRPISLARSFVVNMPIGLMTGWLSAETVFNMTALLPAYGFGGGLLSQGGIAFTAFVGIFAIGLLGLRAVRGDPYHGGALLWAFLGILARNGAPAFGRPLALFSLLAMLVIGAYMAWLRTRPRPHRFY